MSPLLASLCLTGLFIALAPAARCEGSARPAASLLAEAAAAEARFDVPRALELYLAADKLEPDNPSTLQKIAQQLSDLSLVVPDDTAKKAQAEKALAYAKRAVALQPENAVNVLSLAICHGKMGVFSDTRTKIEYSRLVRLDAERALALDPAYDWAHHVLGRWHYEVASLGGTTRFFIRLVYGGLPAASLDEAISHLQKAVSLAPARVPHHLELGFAYLAAGRKPEARASFTAGLALPSVELYDESAKARARSALAKLAEAAPSLHRHQAHHPARPLHTHVE
jgi:tetratricopeptide (TPR) repeat protein